MIYYAWGSSATGTFTGPANNRTGKRSQAGCLSAFSSRAERDRFIEQTKGAAVAVTARQARELKAGLDDRAFNELVNTSLGGGNE